MWTKTVKIKYKGKYYPVQVWFSREGESGVVVVSVRSMYCEWFLAEEIIFQSRDAAYDFIKHYTTDMGKAFFIREGYNEVEGFK